MSTSLEIAELESLDDQPSPESGPQIADLVAVIKRWWMPWTLFVGVVTVGAVVVVVEAVVGGVVVVGDGNMTSVSSGAVVVVTGGRSPSRSEISASSAEMSESPGVARNPLLKASATTRPDVEPQSAPAETGAAIVVDVVVVGADSGENAANPATASSATISQRANAAKRAKRMLFSAF